jgi:hypothetical protein
MHEGLGMVLIRKKASKKHGFKGSAVSIEADSSILALGADKRLFGAIGQYCMASLFWDLGLQ